MNAILLAKFWREVVIFVLSSLFILSLFFVYTQFKTIKHIKTEHELTLVTKEAAYIAQALDMERKSNESNIEVINAATRRAQSDADAANNARLINERLSQTIDRFEARAATDANFRVKYEATTGQLLKNCSSSITELAGLADGHVNDIRTLQDIIKRYQ